VETKRRQGFFGCRKSLKFRLTLTQSLQSIIGATQVSRYKPSLANEFLTYRSLGWIGPVITCSADVAVETIDFTTLQHAALELSCEILDVKLPVSCHQIVPKGAGDNAKELRDRTEEIDAKLPT
jgi:hypothetical protein